MRKLFSNKWIYYIEKHRVTNSVIKITFFAHGGISIKLFVVYLHIINECLSYKFHPYSILTGHTKVESVAYWVLNNCILFLNYQSIMTDFANISGTVFYQTNDKLLIKYVHIKKRSVELGIRDLFFRKKKNHEGNFK